MTDKAYVTALPECDICKHEGAATINPAHYDGKTVMGPWANMCLTHFASHGVGLGTGRGQELIVGEKPEVTPASVQDAIANGASFDEIEDMIGDGDLTDYL